MWYYPETYFLRARDVIAAWLVCVVLGACAIASELVPTIYENALLD
jgi:hypothetical protein